MFQQHKHKFPHFYPKTISIQNQNKGSSIKIGIIIGLIGVVLAGIIIQTLISKFQPIWLSKSAQTFDNSTLSAIVQRELPQTTSNDLTKNSNPIVDSIYFLTGVNLKSPTSLLGSKIAGTSSFINVNPTDQTPKENTTPKSTGNDGNSAAADSVHSYESVTPNNGNITTNPSVATNIKNPIIYIYHTHSWESFLPELGKDYLTANMAVDRKINITLVGAHLAEDLNNAQLPTVQTAIDYWSGGYNEAFNNSRKTVIDELKQHPSINVVFDIHRDDGSRDLTTTTYHGKSYARIFWIIGGSNPNWKVNNQFAQSLSDEFDNSYPADPGQKAINRGVKKVFYPAGSEYNSLFNQDLKSNDVLIEIGGPYNTLQECYNTADVLTNVIKNVIQKMNLISK